MTQGFAVAERPEALGISSKGLLDLIDAAKKKGLDFHSLTLLRRGQIACRMEWAPYDSATPHTLFSLSKSFASCAAGFAVAEGLLSYDTSVTEILTNKLPKAPHPLLRKVTLHSLLCMGSGLDEKSDSARKGRDWVKTILSYPVLHEPGTHFHYNSMSTYLVSAMVQRVTGQTCRDYLIPRLFDKLGIEKPQWDCCPLGINTGGFGLHLKGDDIARFGQLLLQDGVWQGERVLPEDWVKLATAKHIDNARPDNHADWSQGYGYQFWRTRGGRYRGDGMYGQVCMVDEARELVIAITAGIPDMGAEMDLIHDVLIPAVDAPPADAKTQALLQKRIKGLRYRLPREDGSGQDLTGTYLGKGGRMLRLALQADGRYTLLLRKTGAPYPPKAFSFASPKPYRGESPSFAPGESPLPYLGSYAWHKGRLHLSARMPTGPYAYLAELTPEGSKLRVTTRGAGSDEGMLVYTKQA